MAKRRKAIPVTLTHGQRDALERLWFYYGNYGQKATPGNHSFIQRLIENGIDERPLNHRRTPKSQIPTPECEAAVEKILSTARREGDSRNVGYALRIVPPTEKEPSLPSGDPELRAILKEMNLRRRETIARLNSEDDTPDAA
jgi:hypothetical protein